MSLTVKLIIFLHMMRTFPHRQVNEAHASVVWSVTQMVSLSGSNKAAWGWIKFIQVQPLEFTPLKATGLLLYSTCLRWASGTAKNKTSEESSTKPKKKLLHVYKLFQIINNYTHTICIHSPLSFCHPSAPATTPTPTQKPESPSPPGWGQINWAGPVWMAKHLNFGVSNSFYTHMRPRFQSHVKTVQRLHCCRVISVSVWNWGLCGLNAVTFYSDAACMAGLFSVDATLWSNISTRCKVKVPS